MKAEVILSGCVALLTACASAPPRQAETDYVVVGHTDFPPDIGRYASRVESEATMVYVPVEAEDACAGVDPKFRFDSSRPRARPTRACSSCRAA